MSILRSKAERHKAAGDLYVKQGGSKAVRDRRDLDAARIAAAKQAAGVRRK